MAIKYQIVRALNPTFDPRTRKPCCNACSKGHTCESKCPARKRSTNPAERRLRNLANRLARGETR